MSHELWPIRASDATHEGSSSCVTQETLTDFHGDEAKNVLELHNLKLFHPIIQFMDYGHLMKPFYIEIRNF